MSGPKVAIPSLLDRDAELDVLAEAVDRVAAGQGQVLLLEGAPGAGKTRLLGEARALCDRAGLLTLFARGAEMEREYPFGIVRQLFQTALAGPAGSRWLDGQASAASNVFRPRTTVDADAFSTLNGLYWLTVNATAGGPLVVVVDDLHWADRGSGGYLQFLVRRMEELPVLLLVAGRPVDSDVHAELAASPATTVLRPAPLSERAAARLTGELLGVAPAERFARACHDATGGNPLLLVELVRALRAEGVAPDAAHVDEIEQVGPSAVARVVLVRLRRLPPATLAVAQAIAVLGAGADTSLLADLAGVDEPAVAHAIESLIAIDVVDAQPPLGFVHPIVRDAIYRELPPDQRDRRHARAAQLLHARAAEPDRVASHLLLAAPRGERWVAGALQTAAVDASRRGAVETAITFLRRALRERPGDEDAELLFRLGMTEAAIDPPAAVTHLRAARRASDDPTARARIGEMVARTIAFYDPAEAVEAAREARAELPADDVERRAALLAVEHHAGRFTTVVAEPYPDRIPQSTGGRMLEAVRVWDLALGGGGTAAECAAMAASVLGLDGPSGRRPVLIRDSVFTAMIAGVVLVFADDPRAQAFWDAWYADAVRKGRAHALIAAGVWHGAMHFRRGRLAEAEAAIREAMEGPGTWGPGTETIPAHNLSTLAEVLIERGDLAGAQAVLDRVPERLGPDTEGALLSRCSQLRLLTAQGRPQEGLDAVEEVVDRLETVLNPAWYPWRSQRAEALAQLGRTEEAVAAVAEELELARRWGTSGPIGRALALLGVLEDRVELLEEAVETTRGPFVRLTHAQALLALGRTVRRSGRPSEARTHLRDAHELAVACGAHALAQQARDELAVAGGRPRATAGGGVSSLTPSEHRVAELAAAGRRNREIAQQLFLSAKTVEVHLSSAYRKLGIRTRSELPAAMSASPTAHESQGSSPMVGDATGP